MAALVITPQIEEDARRIAEATGTTPTEAVQEALRARLYVLPRRTVPEPRKSLEEILKIVHSHQLQPINDLSEEEILGLDSSGIPEQPYLGR